MKSNAKSQKPRKPRKLPVFLTSDEVRLLLSTPYPTNKRDRMILSILVRCGLRASELVKLRPGDLQHDSHFEEYEIWVREGKGRKDRMVPCPASVAEQIKQMSNGISNDNRILQISYQRVYEIVRDYAKKAGIEKKVTPHTLRHTFAVHAVKSGWNLISVRDALGHSSISTTQIYLEMGNEGMKEDARTHPLPF